MRTLIDTENQTITVKQEFLIDELIALMKDLNIWNYKVIMDIVYDDINHPYRDPFQPYTFPYKPLDPIYRYPTTGDPTPPFFTTSKLDGALTGDSTNSVTILDVKNSTYTNGIK